MAKLSDEKIKSYLKGTKGIKLTAEDFDQIDDDRVITISNMAHLDVDNGSPRRERSAFKNDAEYKYYLFSIVSAVLG